MQAIVFGNIASGKSTVVEALTAGRPRTRAVLEPSQYWEDSGMLSGLYEMHSRFAADRASPEDLARTCWIFQYNALFSRVAVELQCLKLLNRGVVDLLVFDSHRRFDAAFTKAIAPCDGIDYHAWYTESCKMLHDAIAPPREALYLYMATPPQTCMKNLENRGRSCERRIQKPYLEQIDSSMREMATKLTGKVVTINTDGTWNVEQCLSVANRAINEYLAFGNGEVEFHESEVAMQSNVWTNEDSNLSWT